MTDTQTASTTRARAFDGTVHVRFLDTMLASTDKAAVIIDDRAGPLYLIPFSDIYFEFLERTGEVLTHPSRGVLGIWRVTAAGRAEDGVMWTLDEPPAEFAAFSQHAIFDPSKLAVEDVARDPDAPGP